MTQLFMKEYAHGAPLEPSALLSFWERCGLTPAGVDACKRGVQTAQRMMIGDPPPEPDYWMQPEIETRRARTRRRKPEEHDERRRRRRMTRRQGAGPARGWSSSGGPALHDARWSSIERRGGQDRHPGVRAPGGGARPVARDRAARRAERTRSSALVRRPACARVARARAAPGRTPLVELGAGSVEHRDV
jgi:hypothetical protein